MTLKLSSSMLHTLGDPVRLSLQPQSLCYEKNAVDYQTQPAYHCFSRSQWAALRNAVPMPLEESDLIQLRGINENISLKEVEDIYLPLSRLINLNIKSRQECLKVRQRFLGTPKPQPPYIIGIAGSVAVGKSTFARILQALLSRWPEHTTVDLVTTDGFLYPLDTLKKKNLMTSKGFPQSYDMNLMVDFLTRIKEGNKNVEAPMYSHFYYDRLVDQVQTIRKPDILILEGLNVLQSNQDYQQPKPNIFVSDFLDFSIYVDAPSHYIRQWYVDRFMKFCSCAFNNPECYFHHYSKLTPNEAKVTAMNIWQSINEVNLKKNIKPTRERADLILKKQENHSIHAVQLRK
ncbi:Pantothenate kinase [invertebrate metagenome]|uniref:Pantothenate kinase n=1 Tax=invertebrate metagenome TaxID=1711999 RepID=A0A2H9T733_9ZZZZ